MGAYPRGIDKFLGRVKPAPRVKIGVGVNMGNRPCGCSFKSDGPPDSKTVSQFGYKNSVINSVSVLYKYLCKAYYDFEHSVYVFTMYSVDFLQLSGCRALKHT